MNYAQVIKHIGPGPHGNNDLDSASARDLFAAMLDGGISDLELGAILLALRAKSEAVEELLGFYDALAARIYKLPAPPLAVKPVVIPSYGGAREQPNLLPLLALLLKRYGIPVLIHGTLESHGRVTTAHILRELGVMPSATQQQGSERLRHDGIAFLPLAALTPGLAALLALRAQLGIRSSAHVMAKILDPVDGPSVRIVAHSYPAAVDKSRALMEAVAAEALITSSTEGEAFANPGRRPKMELVRDGSSSMLFDAEAAAQTTAATAATAGPEAIDARQTAEWIRQAMAGSVPVPHPILNQVACCLYACGYTENFNQAKAIVAIKSGNLAAA